jgi:hypothetical protein
MLAYIFWHRPYPTTERKRYEQAIVRFQNDLAGSKPPGFIGATSFQIEAVPWLSDLPGYEDWYLLDGTWPDPGHRPAGTARFNRPIAQSQPHSFAQTVLQRCL